MPYKVRLSEPVTRRKRVHWIEDLDGTVLYTSSDATEIFQWLYDNEIRCFLIEAPTGSLEAHLGELLPW